MVARFGPGRGIRPIALAAAVVVVAGLLTGPGLAAGSGAAPPGPDPSTVELTLGPGATATTPVKVGTEGVPQTPDLVFLADTTGSMGGAIANVRENADVITSQVLAAQADAQFGVAEYKDLARPGGFTVNQQLTGDRAEVRAGIAQWRANGGGDVPEDALNALHDLATGAIPFRPGSTPIIAWFGDAPSHDPSGGHTLSDTVEALRTAGVRVVAVDLGELDATGQATAIADATGGVLLRGIAPGRVADAILKGIKQIQVEVTAKPVDCDPRLTVTVAPEKVKVPGGTTAAFTQTVKVAADAPAGDYRCAVDYLVDGESRGRVGTTTVHVHVPGLRVDDVTLPEGNTGTRPATFTVTLDRPSPAPVTVEYATKDGSAVAPEDYVATQGKLKFAPGETSKQVSVPVNGDLVNEPTESFQLKLSAAAGAALADPVGVGVITDEDRDGLFGCRASAVIAGDAQPVVANQPGTPCASEVARSDGVDLTGGGGKLTAQGLSGSTELTLGTRDGPPAEGDKASAAVAVLAGTIGADQVNIKMGRISATAAVTCVPGDGGLVPAQSGQSTVDNLEVNGVPVKVGSARLVVPLADATLTLNDTRDVAGELVQRALELLTPAGTLVLGEAKVSTKDAEGRPSNPCRA